MPSGWSSRPAASTSDQRTLDAAVARMEQMAFDDFEQRHPPSAALDYLLYDVVCDPIPDDDEARFGQTGVDHLVAHADPDLPAGPARWVRLVVGLTGDEYQLSHAELEVIELLRWSSPLSAGASSSPGVRRACPAP
jgi:hypothetical protein